MSTHKVKLIVLSDFLCPWCYVGYRELQTAISQCATLPVLFELEYRPFILHPALTDDAIDKHEWLMSKFGKPKSDAIVQMATARGETAGINFSFNGKVSQTTRAHRLTMKAMQVGGSSVQQALIRLIFKAYMEEEQDIADIGNLSEMAECAGVMSKNEAVAFLKSDECLAQVEQQVAEAREKGVTGVPFTIIDGKWAVSGGQTADVFVKIFRKLAQIPGNPHQTETPIAVPIAA
ncbi:hypothetical protein HETIRDRAFT_439564 [Heterobasidion irregulare TC 32-1]|uniref:DSBA-like thioredoxin domain-containing protein n=1 Tax=Heterobasidion irregulare (strain TC 32-1) TaxID=747525 RepID=W4KB24_HETIT|nr:uncharacterized protein HETIRDRAFT_439564 [Heterobasidion irregulare TC 32-1]ETW82993.1 hypothetical protein HETIRDRAFT_439564 [Heterobasidion irregulare TC 32-1]